MTHIKVSSKLAALPAKDIYNNIVKHYNHVDFKHPNTSFLSPREMFKTWNHIAILKLSSFQVKQRNA